MSDEKKNKDDKKKKKKRDPYGGDRTTPPRVEVKHGGKIGKPIKYAVGGPTKPAWMRNR